MCESCQNMTCLDDGDLCCMALTGHHPACPRVSMRDLARATSTLLGKLVQGIELWGAEEDGVYGELWDAYEAAKRTQGQTPLVCVCGHKWFGEHHLCPECDTPVGKAWTCRCCGRTDLPNAVRGPQPGATWHWVKPDLCSGCALEWDVDYDGEVTYSAASCYIRQEGDSPMRYILVDGVRGVKEASAPELMPNPEEPRWWPIPELAKEALQQEHEGALRAERAAAAGVPKGGAR